jgi:hypothetical protein
LDKPFSELEIRIIEMWFEGVPRDEIAKRLMVSEGKVSSTVGSLPSCLEPLRDLSKKLRKLNLLPHDAIEGVNVKQQLTEVGLTPEQVPISLQAIKKASTEAGYTPEQVFRAAAKLANLENQAGKEYSEAINEFENKIIQSQQMGRKIKEQKQQLSDLKHETKAAKQQRDQALEKANKTEKQISHLENLEAKLRSYGVNLEDAEDLQKYLENMKETRQDPKFFVSFTKKIGSIEKHIFQLAAQEKARKQSLNIIEKDIESEATKLDKILNDHQTLMIQIRNELTSIQKAKSQENEELTRKKAEVAATNILLSNSKKAVLEAEHQKQEIINETERILAIKNYALEHQRALTALETKRRMLADEVETQSSRIAFATIITDFLTTQPDILFDSFHAEVQRIKEIRENPNSPLRLLLPDLTDAMRSKALEAINGNPRFPIINNLLIENQRLHNENTLLRMKLQS